MLRFACLIFFPMFLQPVFAQEAPVYDTSYLPADLKRERLADCGVEIAVDPSWIAEKSRVKLANGKTQTRYSFEVNGEYWDRDKRAAEKIVVNPMLFLTVRCEKTSFKSSDSIDGLAFISEHIYSGMKKQKEYNLAPLRVHNAPGMGRVFQIVGLQKKAKGSLKGMVKDISRFYAVHDDQNISVLIQIDRTPPSKARKKLKAGKKIEMAYASGEVVRFTVARDSRQDTVFGTVYGVRSAKENAQIIERIRASLRGF